MKRAGFWSSVIRAAAILTPDAPERWVEAIRAELYAIPAGGEQRRFALSSIRGLVTIGVTGCVRRWFGHGRALAFAVVLGFAVAAMDQTSQTRFPMVVGLILGAATIGISAPGVSRISGLLLGLSFPVLAAALGARAEYPTDLSHAWIPLLPSIALTSVFGWFRERYRFGPPPPPPAPDSRGVPSSYLGRAGTIGRSLNTWSAVTLGK